MEPNPAADFLRSLLPDMEVENILKELMEPDDVALLPGIGDALEADLIDFPPIQDRIRQTKETKHIFIMT